MLALVDALRRGGVGPAAEGAKEAQYVEGDGTEWHQDQREVTWCRHPGAREWAVHEGGDVLVRNLDTGEAIHVSEIDERIASGQQPQSLRPLARAPPKVSRLACLACLACFARLAVRLP